MSALDAIELFAATVDAGSFASAARRFRLTPSAVSRRVASLEAELGVQLLARTTRTLRLTDDGRAFHARCARILEELHEARRDLARARAKPSGILRVDAPIVLSRHVLAPQIPAFLERYPDLRVDLTVRDQFIDPIAEGIDVLVRVGRLADSSLVARRLGEAHVIVTAAPSYLLRRGRPRTLRDLERHERIGYLRDGQPAPWRFVTPEGPVEIDVVGAFHTNDADAIVACAIAGRGLIATFDFLVAHHLRARRLVRVLADQPGDARPIHALYAPNRHLLPKVRAFVDFASRMFARTDERSANGR
jgi:DNA-binding transcriptional LysR family regulator